ncbi:thiopurine S-methyltransferase [Coralloluteibacterium stylophorae]|uniref:Thiopurine S-methyltransferase n=1 Tax=Coralloluteibacterium stylophorae TaxID=1776034 RepID=A0A8J8AY00_9GAMM|nr:thiopurine S-methyltransferase [Coralloluteibacterium stylophorae]MBS7456022.1 thiopurine S-methyltransferase [Coralloluteibacterium stylophorae]
MDPQYWLDRWNEGRTGWQQDRPTPLMTAHWAALGVAPGGRVFVPLAGKSQDMRWLADSGHRVLGVELSQAAVEQFFAEAGLEPRVTPTRHGRHFEAGAIEIICGDAFALDAEALRDCAAVFDRAALIALPPPMRQRYARELYARLPRGCRGLLITLDYPQQQKDGPPFAVHDAEVRTLFANDWSIDLLERRDILAQEQDGLGAGLTELHTSAYRLVRRSSAP